MLNGDGGEGSRQAVRGARDECRQDKSVWYVSTSRIQLLRAIKQRDVVVR